jgi:Uma2 family endonuclease
MATAATHLMTADEFYDFANRPENRDRHFELEEGEIVEMPNPGHRHGVICGNLTGLFFMYIRQVKRGRVLSNDAGLIIERDPATVRGPDVAVYTDAKKYDELPTRYPDDYPALAVEVLSPSDSSSRTMRRLNRFLDKGVGQVWQMDPDSRTVTIWWHSQAPIVLEDHEEIANLPGLPDFRCKVSEIFDAPGA